MNAPQLQIPPYRRPRRARCARLASARHIGLLAARPRAARAEGAGWGCRAVAGDRRKWRSSSSPPVPTDGPAAPRKSPEIPSKRPLIVVASFPKNPRKTATLNQLVSSSAESGANGAHTRKTSWHVSLTAEGGWALFLLPLLSTRDPRLIEDTMQIISRAQAKALGLKRYFTGLFCKHGHIAERSVANRGCAQCFYAYRLKRYHADPSFRERYLLRNRLWRKAKHRPPKPRDVVS